MADNRLPNPDKLTDRAYNQLDINLKIDDLTVSLTIDRDDEQHLRSAATEVNRVLSLYRDRYGSPSTSDKELVLYTALHFAAQVRKVQIKEQDLALRQRLDKLKDKIEAALYPELNEGQEDRSS